MIKFTRLTKQEMNDAVHDDDGSIASNSACLYHALEAAYLKIEELEKELSYTIAYNSDILMGQYYKQLAIENDLLKQVIADLQHDAKRTDNELLRDAIAAMESTQQAMTTFSKVTEKLEAENVALQQRIAELHPRSVPCKEAIKK